MFGFFKKTNWKIEGASLEFFTDLFSKLPAEFSFLAEGLEKRLYVRYAVNRSGRKNAYQVYFDSSQSDQSMTKGKQFEIQNILISEDGQIYTLNLTIYDGLWLGFEIEKNIVELVNYRIDVSQICKAGSKYAAESDIA